ncbi:cytochrome c biogenesis protein CcsA [Geofilum sp. OHC36d9]|uniref:cytochrome c biogenesis protein CcsA n=1 Tax=Geofilum sp. OHC36d9 TaxID=3458413 RepID=UPI004033D2FE
MKKLKVISFGLLAIMVVILATATIIEQFKGTSFVSNQIYGSTWFVVFWTILVIFALAYLFKMKLQRNPIVFFLHIAFLFILLGAFITWISGKSGSLHLRQGKSSTGYIEKNGNKHQLPFSIELNSFNVIYYPGTQTPQDFESEITIAETNSKKFSEKVSMNNIVSYKGYRFYQSGYDNDGKGTHLSVSHDPVGIAVTYGGYVMLLLSYILFFFGKESRFCQLLKHPLLKNATLVALFLFCSDGVQAAIRPSKPKVLPESVAAEFCNLYVYYNGRICPLQALANDFTLKLYGRSSFKDYTSEQVFTGWLFYYSSWKKQDFIKIRSKEVRSILSVDGKYASFDDFINNENDYKLESELLKMYEGKIIADQKGVKEADEKFNIISMLYAGELTKIFPYATSAQSLNWYATNSQLPQEMDETRYIFIRRSMDYIREMVMKKDFENLIALVHKLKEYQTKEAGDLLPSDTVYISENIYNKMDYTKYLAMFLVFIGIFGFVYFIRCLIIAKSASKRIIVIFNSVILISFIYLTIFITLRGIASQHFPASNGYETMQLLAWASLLASIFVQKKFRMVLTFGLLLGGLALMVSMMGRSNPQITHLIPVLSSPLLSIHVMTIMVSYLLFAFMMFNGVAGIVLRLSGSNNGNPIQRLQIISQLILYPAVFLLAIGTFIGAVWANVSWGRYWGWDPKEVWALITLLIYSFPLHTLSLKRFQQPMFYHIFMVIAFFSVLFTYFGVNFILGGMHSYAG